MSTGRPRKRKPSLSSALSNARRAGMAIKSAVVEADGRIVLTFGEPGNAADNDANPWDEVLSDAADKKRPA
jgi:hypothetical protein